jgi:hypothetical protein
MKSKHLVVLIIGLFLSGCNYKFSETPQTEENGNISNAQTNQNSNNQTNVVNAANTDKSVTNSKAETINSNEPLILSGTSESGNFPCGGREVEVVEDATANSYTLTGECKKLTVDGVSNSVNVEKVGEIFVTGISNKVIYGEGLNGKNPKIKKSGTSTSVDSKKSIEEKKSKADN